MIVKTLQTFFCGSSSVPSPHTLPPLPGTIAALQPGCIMTAAWQQEAAVIQIQDTGEYRSSVTPHNSITRPPVRGGTDTDSQASNWKYICKYLRRKRGAGVGRETVMDLGQEMREMIIFYHKSKDPAIIWLVDSGLLKYSSGLHFLVQRLLVTAPGHIRLSRAASGLQSVWLCNHNWSLDPGGLQLDTGQTEQTFTLTYTLLVNGQKSSIACQTVRHMFVIV